MPSWLMTIVRWTAAIAVMALIVFIAAPAALEQLSEAVVIGTEDEEASRAEPAGPPPIDSGEERAAVTVATRHSVIRDTDEPLVFLSEETADELLIGFMPLPADPACLTSVTLEVSIVESTETELYVRPARVPDLREVEEGAALPPDAFVEVVAPAPAFTSGAPGWLRWDVTDVFALAARVAPEDGTIVLRVAPPPDEDPERVTVVHTGTHEPSQAPRLSWTAVRECEDLGIMPPDVPEQET